MKVILEGGPVGGKETNVDPRTKKIDVPMLGNAGYGKVTYRRTDRRQDGAVIFSINELKLDNPAKS